MQLIFFLKSKKISYNISEFLESRLPLGSSARMILGLFINALATETLCLSPPDKVAGFLSNLSINPNSLNKDIALSFILLFLPIHAGRQTFSKHVNSGSNS